jgi:hypothetical protein
VAARHRLLFDFKPQFESPESEWSSSGRRWLVLGTHLKLCRPAIVTERAAPPAPERCEPARTVDPESAECAGHTNLPALATTAARIFERRHKVAIRRSWIAEHPIIAFA